MTPYDSIVLIPCSLSNALERDRQAVQAPVTMPGRQPQVTVALSPSANDVVARGSTLSDRQVCTLAPVRGPATGRSESDWVRQAGRRVAGG